MAKTHTALKADLDALRDYLGRQPEGRAAKAAHLKRER
jgi:hypothetical protein